MATLALQVAGQSLGASLFGTAGGVIGSAAGALAGGVIDNVLFAPRSDLPATKPLESLTVQSSTEGASIPRIYGRARIAGQVIWATEFEEVTEEGEQGGKGQGGSSGVSYSYYANFAVGLCEGPITRISRIWADGKPLDQSLYDFRVHKGGANMPPDALIEAIEGTDATPGYRDTAYVVFERMPLENFGNRLPQLTFEVVRSIGDLEDMVTAVTVIPSSTEFGYHDKLVTRTDDEGATISDNRHTGAAETDWLASIDELEDLCPNLESVALVVAWFGDDLRCGQCKLRPGVENKSRNMTGASWEVATVDRGDAYLVSQIDDRPAYGGTPSDETVIAAIKDLKSRGLRVVFYPFILMDIENDSGLTDPYGRSEQPPYPWRGRITCHPSPDQSGTPDKTSSAATQVASFTGTAAVGDFSVGSEKISYSGPDEWSYRRMILHYAHLCEAAGGVNTFLIGAEMRGLTQVRSSSSVYPFVNDLVQLASDVKSVVGAGTKVTYGADWSEYFGHHPQDGSNDVYFHLDPLWASSSIDVVGIDNYMPLSDWRDGEHADSSSACSPYDLDYLRSNVAGGEGYDWYYPTASARNTNTRSDITDGAHGKPWVYRYKDLVSWWSNQHYNRPGGVEAASPTDWTPESKPIWFTELGCPAVDRGANQPNVFYDPKSSESFFPYFSSGRRDDFMQRRFLEAILSYWDKDHDDYVAGSNPVSGVYGGRMLSRANIHLWTWDARPFPAFPGLSDVWSDGGNWHLGHWLTGRLGGVTLEALIKTILKDYGITDYSIDAIPGVVDGLVLGDPESARSALEPLAKTFRFTAVDTGRDIRFSGRTCSPAYDIAESDLAVDRDDAARMTITRGQETELPSEVRLSFLDIGRDYESGSASARRLAGDSARVETVNIPVVASAAAMQEAADIALHDLWADRNRFEFAVPRSRAEMETGDVASLTYRGETHSVIVTRIEDAEHRKIEARSFDPSVFRPAPAPADMRVPRPPTVFGAPDAVFLDLPVLDSDDPHHRPRLAVHAKPWPGRMALWRSVSGSGFKRIKTFDRRARIGRLQTALAAGPVARWDRVATLRVTLSRGTLSSREEADVLAGANAAAVQCANGEWEVLQFVNADLVAEKTYDLSTFLRGQLGTEDAMQSGAAVDSYFIFLDGAVEQFSLALDELDAERTYRIGPAGRNIADFAMKEVLFTATGRGLKPLSPVHLRARRDSASGDVTFTWVRRTRIGGDNWNARDVPLGEQSEHYLIDVLSGGTPVRSVETSTSAMTYSAADQMTDFGALQSSYTIRVAQIGSAATGIYREATLNV